MINLVMVVVESKLSMGMRRLQVMNTVEVEAVPTLRVLECLYGISASTADDLTEPCGANDQLFSWGLDLAMEVAASNDTIQRYSKFTEFGSWGEGVTRIGSRENPFLSVLYTRTLVDHTLL